LHRSKNSRPYTASVIDPSKLDMFNNPKPRFIPKKAALLTHRRFGLFFCALGGGLWGPKDLGQRRGFRHSQEEKVRNFVTNSENCIKSI
jgi:hypothetical protein